MYAKTLKILACPGCGNFPLKLNSTRQKKNKIIKGTLSCPKCNQKYSIENGIPEMIKNNSKSEKHKRVMKANIKYHDAVAKDYDKGIAQSVHQNRFNQKRIREIIKSLSQRTQNNYFLDIGCGTGNLLKFGKDYFKNAIGIDCSKKMLEIARKKGYEVIQADATALPFRPNTFNVISAFSVLHHVYNYNKILKETDKILRSKGFLYTDWDPQIKTKIDQEKISWKIFKIINFFLKLIKRAILKIYPPLRPNSINLLRANPHLKNVHKTAEWYMFKGINIEQIRKNLIANNFKNIEISFHWHGRNLNNLPMILKVRFFFLRLQNNPLERFMENIMIIAQKK